MNPFANLHNFERSLILQALEYYILNKQPDPVGGGVPYREDMTFLLNKLRANNR
jgi:hypothetical protein